MTDEGFMAVNFTAEQLLIAAADWRVADAIARNVPDRWADVLTEHPAPTVRESRRILIEERDGATTGEAAQPPDGGGMSAVTKAQLDALRILNDSITRVARMKPGLVVASADDGAPESLRILLGVRDAISAALYAAERDQATVARTLNDRELGTVLAAIQFWKSRGRDAAMAEEIACDAGSIEPLSELEIDQLYDGLNYGKIEPMIPLRASGGPAVNLQPAPALGPEDLKGMVGRVQRNPEFVPKGTPEGEMESGAIFRRMGLLAKEVVDMQERLRDHSEMLAAIAEQVSRLETMVQEHTNDFGEVFRRVHNAEVTIADHHSRVGKLEDACRR